jgi:hypothetical protein
MLLVKKSEGWYNIYNNKVGIGSTHLELQGYKLSHENCDEIFGVVNVEKLVEEEYFKFDQETRVVHRRQLQESLASMFNKAMELNKDKQFTLDEAAKIWFAGQKYWETSGVSITFEDLTEKMLRQPTEIEVEIEMEEYGYCEGCRKAGMWHCAHADTCGYAETRQQPKLDESGCIILKKS